MSTVLARIWVPAVAVVAVTVGAVAVTQLRGAFGSEPIFTATGRNAEPLQPTHVKRVVYEVFGAGGSVGSVNYLDQNAQPVQANFNSLPWTYTVTTTAPAVIASVVAQGDSGRLGCRITVDGEVRQEQSSTGRHAQTSCLVKNA
ncbi:MAG: MmpS family transport accessory protein [Mycobacterium sp.]